jgi:hypothetical protein
MKPLRECSVKKKGLRLFVGPVTRILLNKKMKKEKMSHYKGFDLFNDIEDPILRNRNRAVVIANIAEDNTKNRLISPKGASLVLGYFNEIPAIDKTDVIEKYKDNMQARGYAFN